MAQDVPQNMNDVLVTIRARKLENREIHSVKQTKRFLFDFKPVIFDDRVAEEFMAGFVDLFACGQGVAARQFDFEVFAYVYGAHALVTHMG